jgi:3-oxoacyl-[acyl-carrier protein] reductase
MSMEGKIALITGGSGGIGRACALDLAAAGATVIVNYCAHEDSAREVVSEICGAGGRAVAIRGDVASTSDMERLVDEIGANFGRLNFLVNNAGIIRDRLLLDMDDVEWDEVIRVNLRGVFATTKATLPLMFGEEAAIVNISSIAASVGSKGHVNYAASKGGVEAFTRALAIELAPKRIRVNAVAPGYITTAMSDDVRASTDPRHLVPMRRFGETHEVAGVVTFLLSDRAAYITGEVVRVAGGIQ